MSILIGVGVVSSITVFYLARKGWHAFHKAVGITPGVLIYHDSQTPATLTGLKWQQLTLNKSHLSNLPNQQLYQLQRIDEKVAIYQHYQQQLEAQQVELAITEEQFVLHKLLHTRLPEMLASYHQLLTLASNSGNLVDQQNDKRNEKRVEGRELLQQVVDNIEERLDDLLEKIETQQLQDLRVMKNYIDNHNS